MRIRTYIHSISVIQHSNWEVTFEGEKEQQPASNQPKMQRKNTATAAAGKKRKNSSDGDESASSARPKKACFNFL